ncbi:hypothetical protein DPMN_053625 [Dreissena polymorpha]|uniref:Uncharacterized protein n=1 Tax=Dreissena polymorpha TaxID=45954 RepID=A0A9D4CLP8_DREPO|nr:hypothetical protein DPMN_053625 [Dreissena polymorpha]
MRTGPITKQEITKAINKIKSRKTPGPDKIPTEAMKASTSVLTSCLTSSNRSGTQKKFLYSGRHDIL